MYIGYKEVYKLLYSPSFPLYCLRTSAAVGKGRMQFKESCCNF